jgi:hypothetical protein
MRDWHRIVNSLLEVNLQEGTDTFTWSLHSSGRFSVKSMYVALINNGVRVSQDIWHVKIPTKIKIFLWYLKLGVTLTKDNLARRNWEGDKRCGFCYLPESIQHLFLDCYYAKFLWRLVHLLFGIPPLHTIDDLFNHWSKVGSGNQNNLMLIAAAALCWSIWLTRNEVVFDKGRPKTFLQVLFRGTHWLRQWAKLQRCEDLKNQLIQVCQHIEVAALRFFGSNGWSTARRIGLL